MARVCGVPQGGGKGALPDAPHGLAWVAVLLDAASDETGCLGAGDVLGRCAQSCAGWLAAPALLDGHPSLTTGMRREDPIAAALPRVMHGQIGSPASQRR